MREAKMEHIKQSIEAALMSRPDDFIGVQDAIVWLASYPPPQSDAHAAVRLISASVAITTAVTSAASESACASVSQLRFENGRSRPSAISIRVLQGAARDVGNASILALVDEIERKRSGLLAGATNQHLPAKDQDGAEAGILLADIVAGFERTKTRGDLSPALLEVVRRLRSMRGEAGRVTTPEAMQGLIDLVGSGKGLGLTLNRSGGLVTITRMNNRGSANEVSRKEVGDQLRRMARKGTKDAA